MAKKRRKKSGRTGRGLKTVIIVAVLTFVAGLIVVAKFGGYKPGPSKKTHVSATRAVDLYLSDAEGTGLKPLKRDITKGSIEKELREAVGALIEDPSSTIPAGTRLLGVKVDGEVAFVDFSGEIIKNHPGGSSGETQTIYSIVDTVTLNFPVIKEVQILVEGRTEKTLAGHIDISMPLVADKDIIAE